MVMVVWLWVLVEDQEEGPPEKEGYVSPAHLRGQVRRKLTGTTAGDGGGH